MNQHRREAEIEERVKRSDAQETVVPALKFGSEVVDREHGCDEAGASLPHAQRQDEREVLSQADGK
ncbi:hypothetical protein FAZ95_31045 [Trinickia violacea]|uniref:Uncharacterized protein n=1 Tax=Trinickia violacea TaxID=2571746 RepID=A0A4P8IY57_9BURK|nr:hypothetical protein FAZ95_31045 [Trinickia violacea]